MPANKQPRSSPKRVAIVGGGISGIACSWTLRKQDYVVDIYEADVRLGGHANSVPFKGNGNVVDVDTGFIAMDETTYPQFTAFLQQLSVKTIPTDMSFGVSANHGAFEWGSYSIQSFCHSFSLLFSSWFWRLLFDILRFSLFAEDILDEGPSAHELYEFVAEPSEIGRTPQLESIGTYLRRHRYSEQFMTYFLIPMVAAPWCIDPDDFASTFPAKPLIKFMIYHQLLDTVATTLRWRSFRNGSKTYVDAFQEQLPERHRLHLETTITGVAQTHNGASLKFSDGSRKDFDHVVLAIHAKQALALLGHEATDAQRTILGAFTTSRNVCYLHSDETLLPKRHSARVAWNCLLDQQPEAKFTQSHSKPVSPPSSPPHRSKISITFDMNKLQDIPMPGELGSPGRVLVTMNPNQTPQASQSSHVYHHPLITSGSILMSRHLNTINGVRNVSFAGAWMGFGFHEDGFAAGSHAANIIMNGHEKTRSLNLVARVDNIVRKDVGYGRSTLKIAISTLLHALDTLYKK